MAGSTADPTEEGRCDSRASTVGELTYRWAMLTRPPDRRSMPAATRATIVIARRHRGRGGSGGCSGGGHPGGGQPPAPPLVSTSGVVGAQLTDSVLPCLAEKHLGVA